MDPRRAKQLDAAELSALEEDDCDHLRVAWSFGFDPASRRLARAAEQLGFQRAIAGVATLYLSTLRQARAFSGAHGVRADFRALVELVGGNLAVFCVSNGRYASLEQVPVDRVRRSPAEWRLMRRNQRKRAAERRDAERTRAEVA